MKSYLHGRKSVFEMKRTAIAEPETKNAESPGVDTVAAAPENVEVVSDGPNAPKVELVSVDGRVERILITTQGGEYLELHCKYS